MHDRQEMKPTSHFNTPADQLGTINLVLACNALPDLSGKIEAVHMATMAKAAALKRGRSGERKIGKPRHRDGNGLHRGGRNGGDPRKLLRNAHGVGRTS